MAMRQTQMERKARRPRDDRNEGLPLDPRDPDILRAKRPPRQTEIGRA